MLEPDHDTAVDARTHGTLNHGGQRWCQPKWCYANSEALGLTFARQDTVSDQFLEASWVSSPRPEFLRSVTTPWRHSSSSGSLSPSSFSG